MSFDPPPEVPYDAMVIGGSYAGLSAALQLARARRRVLVIDAGKRRNRFVNRAHGFLTHDGHDPAGIAAVGRSQLLAYGTVTFIEGEAVSASALDASFSATLGDGSIHRSRRVILATGVTDILPGIPGLAERWGRSVFICPYCDGYELEQGEIGVIATSPNSYHQAMMLPDWGPTTYFLNGAHEPDAEQLAALERRNVTVEAAPVTAISGERADLTLADGRVLSFRGVFTASRVAMSSPVAEQLGCAFEEGPLGPVIKTSPMRDTSVGGVFACGDVTRGAGSVALAVGDGAMAGAATHRSLIFEDA